MSVEYFYENDLNMLYNAAVNNNPDGGEHHTKMLESYNNLVAYIRHIEHWKPLTTLKDEYERQKDGE